MIARGGWGLGLAWLSACPGGDGGTGSGGSGFVLEEDIQAQVAPAAVSFGLVPLGETATAQILLTHVGTTGTLQVRGAKLVDASTDLRLDGFSPSGIEPGASALAVVTYRPTDALPDTGTLEIETNVPAIGGGTETFQVLVSAQPQIARVVANPSLVAFGGVATGTSATKTFALQASGGLPVSVTSLGFLPDASKDFAIVETPELPASLGTHGAANLTIRYTPTGEDTDLGDLRVGFSSMAGDGEHLVAVLGQEVRPRLVATPGVLDFGPRKPGEVHKLTLSVENQGTLAAHLTEVAVLEASPYTSAVSTKPLPLGGVEIAAGGSYPLEVRFQPVQEQPPSGDPLALLELRSDDPDGPKVVKVFGKRLGTSLEVYPPDIVYFGFVGAGGRVSRVVTLYNAGNAPVTVESGVVLGSFDILDQGWGPTQLPPVPAAIGPGELVEVTVEFKHEGGDWDTTWGKLVLSSDDPVEPKWDVLLQVRSAGIQGCVAQLVPDRGEVGFVVAGQSRPVTLHLVNVGDFPCGFQAASLADCTDLLTCTTPQDPAAASTSAHFAVTKAPEVASDNLPPGGTLPIEVTFTAPPMPAGKQQDVLYYFGMLAVGLSSLDDDGKAVETVLPPFGYWGSEANLEARAALGELVVSPPEIAFGEVPVGCAGDLVKVTATNVGNAPLAITDFVLAGCSPEVVLESYPALDQQLDEDTWQRVLDPEETVSWEVSYAPQDAIPASCALEIVSPDTDAPTQVPIQGAGTWNGTRTDIFTEPISEKVDVLFVIDDSGSMSEEQANVTISFESFVAEAATWQSDYRIGVTTTDTTYPLGGTFRGNPRWVTPANWEKFLYNAAVGVFGSGNEQGLWAAEIALSPQMLKETGTACDEKAECSFFEYCTDGTCGGYNKGFLREDASLEVIFVSDEEDASPQSWDYYLTFLRSLKGLTHPEKVHVHAIVGPPGDCISANGNAVAGHRYRKLAEATGGVVYSICELDFAKGLEGIGEVAFGAQMQYFLSQVPAPSTIQVSIQDTPCPLLSGGAFNWKYDAAKNSVTISDQGICAIGPGDAVRITYDLLCFAGKPAP
jgi:hypothetical protein